MRRIPVVKVFFRKRKRPRPQRQRRTMSPMAAASLAVLVIMVLYYRHRQEEVLADLSSTNNLLTVVTGSLVETITTTMTPQEDDTTIQMTTTIAALADAPLTVKNWDEYAKQTQQDYCQQLAAASSSSMPLESTSQRPRPSTVAVTVNVTVPYGGTPFRMQVYAAHDVVSTAIRKHGVWDARKTRQLIEWWMTHGQQQQSTSVFVDIGAHVGWFTLVLASLGAPVVAFEALPDNVQLLRTSLCHNANHDLASRVTLHAMGLSSSSSTSSCLVYSDQDNFGDGLLHCHDGTSNNNDFVPPPRYFVREQTVPVMRLDDVWASSLSSHKRTIAAVKMDVEGHETLVLQGGKQTLLQQSPPVSLILTEWNTAWIQQQQQQQADNNNPAAQQVLLDLFDAGYTIRREADNEDVVLLRYQVQNVTHWQGTHDLILEWKSTSKSTAAAEDQAKETAVVG